MKLSLCVGFVPIIAFAQLEYAGSVVAPCSPIGEQRAASGSVFFGRQSGNHPGGRLLNELNPNALEVGERGIFIACESGDVMTLDPVSLRTIERTNLTYNHIVVVSGLTPSKVYHLRALSKDSADNQGNSIDQVTITPKSTESALNLVIGNLSDIFSFLGNLNP